MAFKEGNIPWNKNKKGHKPSKETRKKMRLNNAHYWLGKKASAKTREKHRIRMLGNTLKRGTHYSKKQREELSVRISGAGNPRWKGGKQKDKSGYILVWQPNHPCANGRGYIREHRLVMEKHIGRTLLPTEVVHHVNGDHGDNRIENLMLFANNNDHLKHHFSKGSLVGKNKKGEKNE